MDTAKAFRGTYGTMYYVKNMSKTVAYYRDKFGIEPLHESPEWTEFSFNGHSLCLHAVDPKQKQAASAGGILITKVKGLEKLVPELKKRGVEFCGEIKEVCAGAYAADFVDPSGNIVSLYENTKD